MNIDKAIRVLSSDNPVLTSDEVPIFDEAIQLGIEALKHYKAHRPAKHGTISTLLPGETKD